MRSDGLGHRILGVTFARGLIVSGLTCSVSFGLCQPMVSNLSFYQVDWDTWAGWSQSNSLWGGAFVYLSTRCRDILLKPFPCKLDG